jgi:hypothetical protein
VTKRAFERKNGILSDRYVGDDGRQVCAQMPAAMLGEEPKPEERGRLITKFKSTDTAVAQQARYALHTEASAEHLDELLDAVKAGADPSLDLVKYVDDPRVRPAIVDAARRKDLAMPGNVYQVLGIVGGAGAAELLRDVVRDLLADAATFADDKFFNRHAGDLVTASRALLALDTDAIQAAEAIVRVIDEHPVKMNRESAAWSAAEALVEGSKTAAMIRLRKKLEILVDDDAPPFFFRAAPSLARERGRDLVERMARYLDNDDAAVRMSAFHALSQFPPPHHVAALRCLVEWFPRTRTTRETLSCAGSLAVEVVMPLSSNADLRRALDDLADVAVDETNGDLLLLSERSRRIVRVHPRLGTPASLAMIRSIELPLREDEHPDGVTIDTTGRIWIVTRDGRGLRLPDDRPPVVP